MSEPNERESFDDWYDENKYPADTMYEKGMAYIAWHHQQNRIDELEEKLQWQLGINKGWMESQDSLGGQIKSLQAKLNVAVNALEFYKNLDWKENTEAWQLPATEALAEIKKIGE